MERAFFIVFLGLLLAISGCGKAVGTLDRNGDIGCEQELRWSYQQPQPSKNRRADLLFVVDTSSSLSPERDRIASAIPGFLGRISRDADLRIGVMPAHGGASPNSGRLFSAPGSPLVIKTSSQASASAQAQLRETLRRAPSDRDEANGEMGMYSLMKSFQTSRVAEIQAQGFYRPDAALSIVFLTDENDICFSPEQHGFTAFPDFVPSLHGSETIAFGKYCSGITPESVIARAREFNRRLSVAGIVHQDPAAVPSGGQGSEDAIGHGILELVQQSVNGIVFEIARTNFDEGLVRLANVVETQLDLRLSFVLDGDRSFQPETLKVSVDGVPVVAGYDPGGNAVELKAADAGRAGSLVEITACSVGS